jgi:hypothetical protein
MDFLKSILPTLASALGGPLAGGAAAFFAEKLGLPDKTVEAVVSAVKGATPEQLAALKQIDADLKAMYLQAGVKLEEIAAADRDSARKREVATGDSWTPRLLAVFIMGAWLFIQYSLLTQIVPSEMREIFIRGLGTLDMAVGLCLGYYYGSSSSSSAKNDLLARSK